jgi:hypothetical protein
MQAFRAVQLCTVRSQVLVNHFRSPVLTPGCIPCRLAPDLYRTASDRPAIAASATCIHCVKFGRRWASCWFRVLCSGLAEKCCGSSGLEDCPPISIFSRTVRDSAELRAVTQMALAAGGTLISENRLLRPAHNESLTAIALPDRHAPPNAQRLSTRFKGRNTRLCVIDSGIDSTHPHFRSEDGTRRRVAACCEVASSPVPFTSPHLFYILAFHLTQVTRSIV